MVQVTNAFDSYEAVGNREDLTDAIYNISPSDTPFLSAIGRGKATATLHEWQTDSLATPAANAQLEGDTTSRAASSPTVRLNNVCMISNKDATVTGTQEVVRKGGRRSSIQYHMASRTKELKLDICFSFVGAPTAKVTGGVATPRVTASVESWLASNTSRGTGGVDPTGDGSDIPTDGTQRAFTETLLKDVIQSCYQSGGNPNIIMAGPFNKVQLSGFVGRTTARQNISSTKIQAAASLYASDFGDFRVVPNRVQRARSVFVIDPQMWRTTYLRQFVSFPLSKVGDADTRVILSEYALEACNEASSGVVADLTVA